MHRAASKTRSLKSLSRNQSSVSNSIKSAPSIVVVDPPSQNILSQPSPVLSPLPVHSIPQGLVVTLQNMAVCDVANVAWNENNNLYILIENQSWLFKTDVLYESGTKGHWKGNIVNLDLFSSSPRGNSSNTIKMFVHHACWAIQDKLIGFCEIPISVFNPSSPSFDLNDYSTVLYDSTNLIKRKVRGSLSFQWKFEKGTQSVANISPRIREEGSRLSAIDAASVISKYVDVADNHQVVNGISPRQVVNAANILQGWEGPDPATNSKYSKSKPMASTKDIPKVPKIPLEKATQQAIPIPISTKITEDKSPSTRMKTRKPTTNVDTTSSNGNHATTSPISTARISNITEEQNANAVVASPRQKRKSSISSTNRRPSTTPLSFSVKVSKEIDFSIDHSIDYVFDQAFLFSLLKLSSHCTFSIQDLIILLDSLEIPINEPFLSVLNQSERTKPTSSGDRHTEEIFKESISFPINHPTSFAASIIDIIQNKYPMIISPDVSLPQLLTPLKVVQCLLSLIDLLKINYVNIRGLIFLACSGKSEEEFGQSIKRKSYKATGASKNNNNLDVESVMRRPTHFTSPIMKTILQSIRHSPSLSSSTSITSNTDFFSSGLSGKDFLQLSSKDFTNNFSMRSSLLMTRIKLYQSTLNILESCWDRGIRPQDKPLSFKNQSSNELSTSTSFFQQPSYQQITRTLSRQMVDKTKSFDGSINNSSHLLSNTKGGKDDTTHSSNSQNGTINNANFFLILQDPQLVLNQYLSLNRAFGWNYSVSLLTVIANQISGCYCYQLPNSDRLTSHELEDFYSKPVGRNNNSNNNRNTSYASSSGTSGGIATCPELVWVSLLFLNDQLYQDCNSLLLSLSKEYSTIPDMEFVESSVPPIYHLFECIPNNREILIHLPKNCLKSLPKTSKQSNPTLNKASQYSTKLQELYQLFYSLNYNTLPMEDITVGMKARIVSFPVLHRITSSKYEWWDRPSEEMLQKMANKKCEIISINELYSEKQRVGIKLLNTNICEAIPYDALFPVDPDASYEENDEIEEKEIKIKEKKKDTESFDFIARNDVTQSSKPVKRRKSKRKKSLKNELTGTVIYGEETTKKGNKEEENDAKKTLQLKSPDAVMVNNDQKRNTSNTNINSKKIKPSAVVEDKMDAHDDANFDLLAAPKGGDESFLPENAELKLGRSSSTHQIPLQAFTIAVEATTKTGRKTKDQAQKSHTATFHPNVLNIELLTSEKDYSWIKPPSKKDFSNFKIPNEMKKMEDDGQLILENLEDDPTSNKNDVTDHDRASPLRASSPIQKMREADFDLDHAIYTHGVYKYSDPSGKKDSNRGNSSLRPKSASAMIRKKESSPESPESRTKKSNQQDRNNEQNQMKKRPKTASALNFELEGLGYDGEGHLRTADQVDSSPLPSPKITPLFNEKERLILQTNPALKKTYKYMEAQMNEDESDKKHLQSLGVNGSTIPLTTFDPWGESSSPEKSPNQTKVKKKKKFPLEKEERKESNIVDDNGSDEEKPVKFDVNVKKATTSNRKSLKEALLYEREKIRNQKEVDIKENYILKELKSLGIDISQIKY